MKKTYINPTMTIVKIKTRSLLNDVSQPGVSISKSGAVDAGEVESRSSRSIWDDEEDYE